MPKYKFVNGNKALTAVYNGKEQLVEFSYNDGRFVLTIKNVGGSVVLIDEDAKSSFLNKIHLGELVVRNPHAERFVETGVGPRVDLHEMDLHYANERLEELVRWTNPGYRKSLRDYHYSKVDLYFVRSRLRQLAICTHELERKIEEHRTLVKMLESRDDSRFIYPLASAIEGEVKTLDTVAKVEIEQFLGNFKPKKKGVKVVSAFKVLEIVEEVYPKLREALRFVNDKADFERARRYWDIVDEWAPKSSYVYIGLVPGAREHIARHFEGSGIVGSGFFEDFIPRLRYAIKEAKGIDFHGGVVALKREFPEPVGFNSVVAIKDLPLGVEVKREMREHVEVNVVHGLERTLTNQFFIILSPWEGNDYGIHTIYPGENPSPLFSDTDFLDRHAFIWSS